MFGHKKKNQEESAHKQLIEKPTDVQAPKIDARIFTMPEEYRHKSVEVLWNKSLESVKKPVPAAPVSVKPLPKPPISPSKKSLPRTTKWLLIFGGIVLLVLCILAVVIYLGVEKSSTPVYEEPVPRPAPTTSQEQNADSQKEETEKQSEEESETQTQDPFAGDLYPGRDVDSDGLSDMEETLYGTNVRLPDTDADGFLDGNEVFHGYHPNGPAPFTLLDAGLVKVFEQGLFSLFYPVAWKVEQTSGEGTIIFTATTGESITVFVEQKDLQQSLSDWFKAQDANRTQMELTTTKAGYPAITTQDGMITAIDLGEEVVTLQYVVISKNSVDYLQTVQMMVNSVRMQTPTQSTESTEDTAVISEE